MIQKCHFDKDNRVYDIPLNEENPYFKIVKIVVPETEAGGFYPNLHRFYIRHRQYRGNSGIEDTIVPTVNEGYVNTRPIIINIDKVVNNGFEFRFEKINLSYGLDDYIGFDFDLYYDTEPLDLPLDDPYKTFNEHISEYGNSRILFSAPYGAGKTSFLKDFFRKNEDKYEVIYLYPVNYSVAKNEDIFKYIKCGILFQLLSKDVEFNKEEFKYIETLPQFVLQNPTKLLAPFIKLLPAIGGSAYEVFKKLEDLTKEYFDHHKKLQADDKDKAINYIEKIYNEEGSIFEDNFYTQLIRNLIEQINSKGKQTVLVIDDMDRMDPDHIFRVLNVFAAHFDTQEYDYGNSNKFGFKRIVFVCDIHNIKRLFQYRYGDNVDFAGYIDKFFSNSIYQFSNTYAVQQFIESIRMISPENFQLTTFLIILQDLYITGNLSLREILKLRKTDFFAFKIANKSESNKDINRFEHYKLHYFPHIYYLNQIFSIDEIIDKLKKCSENINEKVKDINYSKVFIQSLATIAEYISEDGEGYCTFSGEKLVFLVNSNPQNRNGFYYDVTLTSGRSNITAKDFYLALAEITKKYDLFGGLGDEK